MTASAAPADAARKASMVIDANTGRTLYASNPDRLCYPASLTKVMTLFLVFDDLKRSRLKFNTRIKFSRRAARVQPSKLGIKAGGTITVRNAIKALITKSANDVAIALAEHISGSERAFARRMTRRARELGMARTVFKNASGLPNSDQVTTAREMITLALRLMDIHGKHYHLFSMRSFTYKGRKYKNHNGLLRNFRGTDGLKTGYTSASGFNLVASTRRNGKHVIGAVFGGKTAGKRNALMRSLLTKSFKKASTRKTRQPKRFAPQLVARAKPAVRRVKKRRLAKRRLVRRPRHVPQMVVAKISPARLARSAAQSRPSTSPTSTPVRISRVRQFRFGETPSRQVAPRQVAQPALLPRSIQSGQQVASRDHRVSKDTARVDKPRQRISTGRQPSTFQMQATQMQASQMQATSRQINFRGRNTTARQRVWTPTPMAPQDQQRNGGYHVQVGSYGTRKEARQRVEVVRAGSVNLLAGHATITMPFRTRNKQFYRARFAGFDNAQAKAACQALLRRKVACYVARAN